MDVFKITIREFMALIAPFRPDRGVRVAIGET
jgi:hypothetical protein